MSPDSTTKPVVLGKPCYCFESQFPGLSNRVNMLFEGLVFFSSCPSSLIPRGQCPHDHCICLTFLPLFLSYQTLIQDEASFLSAFCLPKCLWALWKKHYTTIRQACVIVYCPQPASLTLVCSWVGQWEGAPAGAWRRDGSCGFPPCSVAC